ncbi:MAG: hypothetical protein KDC44_06325 [Phaeodactylibacter sp.]|nr:hypothetical protein [Phaeodactylibacter sp.]
MKLQSIGKKEFDAQTRFLPQKERFKLWAWLNRPGGVEREELEGKVASTRELMKRDLLFGLPWFGMLAFLWFGTGITIGTIILLFMGIFYFTYTFFTTGSYGMNRKRLKLYRYLLEK